MYLSDVLPTAWQSVEYAGIPDGGTVCVLGLGPIGDMATRVALHRGHRVISVDLVPERLARATKRGAEVLDYTQYNGDLGDKLRDMTDGRGPDSVIDSVGMEAHGAPVAKMAHQLVGLLPDAIGEKVMEKAGIDRMGPAADAHPVRQAGAAAHGPGERQALGRRHLPLGQGRHGYEIFQKKEGAPRTASTGTARAGLRRSRKPAPPPPRSSAA